MRAELNRLIDAYASSAVHLSHLDGRYLFEDEVILRLNACREAKRELLKHIDSLLKSSPVYVPPSSPIPENDLT